MNIFKKIRFLNLTKRIQLTRSVHILEKNKFLSISEEIKQSDKPVVALESTIITHGLPYPLNLETALQVENVVRELNVIPATIGFLNGQLKVGLNKSEIETLAKGHEKAVKISRRDLSYMLNASDKNLVGGTTVSTTCIAANAAGIKIFATGGIGGVHRDFNETMDVSADLFEISRIPIAVVSSGVKSILDIGKTLEYLETIGVCTFALNSNGSNEFPCFFTSKSGHYAQYNFLNETEAAQLIFTNSRTGLNNGILIGVPIPPEYSANPKLIDDAIQKALSDSKKMNIKGKKVTPYLLEKINQITKGKSVSSNIALIKNNAKTSAKIALELKKLEIKNDSASSDFRVVLNRETNHDKQITVIGGLNLDTYNRLIDEKTIKIKGVTQPSEFYQVIGGVGYNMANALIRLKQKSVFITALGNDIAGNFIKTESQKLGFDISKWLFLNQNVSTGSYSAILDPFGELMTGCGDMRAHYHISKELVEKHIDDIKNSELVAIDADIPLETIKYICDFCFEKNIPIWYNPTDLRKCNKVVEADSLSKLTYISPNLKELYSIFESALLKYKTNDDQLTSISIKYSNNLSESLEKIEFEDLKIILKYLLDYVPFIILSRGSKELLFASKYDLDLNEPVFNQLPVKRTMNLLNNKNKKPTLLIFPVVNLNENEKFVNVSGAGDSCSSGIMSGILNGYRLSTCIYNGLFAAKLALMTRNNVSADLEKIHHNDLEKFAFSNKDRIRKLIL